VKKAYVWVVIWPECCTVPVSCDLFFSSRARFLELVHLNEETAHEEQLVEIKVPDDFDDWDYIPDNY